MSRDLGPMAAELVAALPAVRRIADLAYHHAAAEGLETGPRRAAERIGMRATDLVSAIAEFVNSAH